MPFNLSTGEIMVLLIVAILVFGGRLPDVARKVARGLGEFRRGMSEEMRRIDNHLREDEPPPDWSSPPDGADCDGFGNIEPGPPDEEADRVAREAEVGGAQEETGETEDPVEPVEKADAGEKPSPG